jgi:hypothetical protein
MNESLSAGDMTPELSVVMPCYNEEAVVATRSVLSGGQRSDVSYSVRSAVIGFT